MELIGLTEREARETLARCGIAEVKAIYEVNDKQSQADTMLVIRARVENTRAELLLTPFILQER